MRGWRRGWAVAGSLMAMGVSAGCQTRELPPAEAAAATQALPEPPHPPGHWVLVEGARQPTWVDSLGITQDSSGVLLVRQMRETLGEWRIAIEEVRCGTLEVRWRSEERWDGDQQVETEAAPDATDDWYQSVPGGPRRVVILTACRLAGVPVSG